MKKKYSIKALNDIFPEGYFQTEDDITINYMVTKVPDSYPDMKSLINVIIAYVQNSEIYFKGDPGFVHDVLIFSIVGTEEEHNKLKNILGGDIEKLNCKLSWELLGEENGKR